MAEKPKSTARSVAVTVVGALLAAYLPCTWVLVSDVTVIKHDRLFCFAEMPIVLTQLPLELAGWTNVHRIKRIGRRHCHCGTCGIGLLVAPRRDLEPRYDFLHLSWLVLAFVLHVCLGHERT